MSVDAMLDELRGHPRFEAFARGRSKTVAIKVRALAHVR